MVIDHGIIHGVREIAISKFKATCLAVLENVRRSRTPVRVTRFGRPVADILPPAAAADKPWLGCLRDSLEIHGELVEPAGAFRQWTAGRR